MASLLATVFLFHAGVCHAQADPALEKKVREWFEKEWEAAKKPPDIASGLRWQYEDLFHPTATALEQLQQAVQSRPEHPQRQQLERYKRHMRGEPSQTTFTVYWRGLDSWRMNNDSATDNYMLDSCVHGKSSWRMGGRNSVPTNITYRAQIMKGTADSDESVFRAPMAHLLQGGLGIRQLIDSLATPQIEIMPDGRWVAEILQESKPGSSTSVTYRFKGTWSEPESRGFVEQLDVTKPGVLEEYYYNNWSYYPTPGAWACGLVDCRRNGEVVYFLIFEEFPVIPPGGLDAVFKQPRPGNDDVLRGSIPTSAVLYDEVTGTLVSQNLSSRDGVDTLTLPRSQVVRRVNWYGFEHWTIVVCVILVGVCIVWVRRHIAR